MHLPKPTKGRQAMIENKHSLYNPDSDRQTSCNLLSRIPKLALFLLDQSLFPQNQQSSLLVQPEVQ